MQGWGVERGGVLPTHHPAEPHLDSRVGVSTTGMLSSAYTPLCAEPGLKGCKAAFRLHAISLALATLYIYIKINISSCNLNINSEL